MSWFTEISILCFQSLKVLSNCYNLKVNVEQIEDDLTKLGMDSITFIQIIVGLEEVFECEITDDKLLITEMGTIQMMFDVLQGVYQTQ